MSDLITTPPTGRNTATVMQAALAPFKLKEQWCSQIQAAERAAEFVAYDKDGSLVALSDDADWKASRARAVEIQAQLPPLSEIEAAYAAVDRSIRVKPAPQDYEFMLAMMLDVFGIRAGDGLDAYAEILALELAEVHPGDWERGVPLWIPIAALAKAIRRMWRDRAAWNHYGRQMPFPDLLDLCVDARRDLVGVRDKVVLLGRTQHRLGRIIEVVNASEAEDDDW